MKKYAFLFASLITTLNIFSQTNVVPFLPNDPIGDGIVYYLPKTVVNVEAEAEQTIQKAGPFVNYARLYLGVKDFITENKTSWNLKSVKLRTIARPDHDRAFKIIVAPNTVAPFVTLDKQGIICAVNTSIEKNQRINRKPNIASEEIDTVFCMNLLGQEALIANSIPKMAELAAKQIYRIRENRANLLSGENELLPDGTALKEMIAKLESDERELTALFIGKTATRTTKRNFEYEPQKTERAAILFRISRREGIVTSDNLTGAPIYVNCEIFRKEVAENNDKRTSENGIFYTVPGKAHIVITDNNTVFAEKDVVAPQLGGIAALPAALFNKSDVKVEFNPATGQIVSIKK